MIRMMNRAVRAGNHCQPGSGVTARVSREQTAQLLHATLPMGYFSAALLSSCLVANLSSAP
jgi:hypothetical protein